MKWYKSRKISEFLNRWAPFGVSKWIYFSVLKLFSFVLRAAVSKELEVWARNSVLTPAFKPFISDLDFTIYTSKNLDLVHRQRVQKIHRIFKSVFPIMGEINLISGEGLKEFSPYFNPAETRRDPVLSRKLELDFIEPNSVQRSVFIFRMLDSDTENLLERHALRYEKWRGHFKSVGLKIMGLSDWNKENDVVGYIAKQALGLAGFQGEEVERLSKKICNFLKSRNLQSIDEEISFFFPHKLAYSMEFENLPSKQQLEVMRHQLNWEIWGVATQWQGMGIDNYASHFGHLKRMLRVYDGKMGVSFQKEISAVSALPRRLRDSL